jgi:hypothetical protein
VDEDMERRRSKRLRDAFFVAPLFIGLAVGIAVEQVAVGVLAGLGVGFLLSALVSWQIGKQ